METVTLRYVGPHDAVEIAATGDLVERDGTVEVSADLAGRAPDGDDRGEGLLAQEANWELADKPLRAPKGRGRKLPPADDTPKVGEPIEVPVGEAGTLEEGGDA